jgi:hypothetical protein
LVATYVADVAPAIPEQPVPAALHRSHPYANVACVLHAPVVLESALPTAALPESVGAPVEAGVGTTTALTAETAEAAVPIAFCALTSERTVLPTSAAVSW